jgi:ABC-type transporter Mla MlaB component
VRKAPQRKRRTRRQGPFERVLRKLDAILAVAQRSERKVDHAVRLLQNVVVTQEVEMKELDDLETEVAQVKTVDESALALIQGLAAQLASAGTDPAKLKALRDGLAASSDALAAAVAANTPASSPS